MTSTRMMLIIVLAGLAAGVFLTADLAAVEGNVKLGYIYTDEEGNLSVYQPTFNLYEGVALSLEDFRYDFANGVRVRSTLQNVTLKNRRAQIGVTRGGLFGANLSGSQYRRTYSFSGDRWARRDQWGGDVWVKPLPQVKLYGGYALVSRTGKTVELFDPGQPAAAQETDYDHHRYHVGVQANHQGRMIQAEYRRADFRDQRAEANDRLTTRYKIVSVAPLPRIRTVLLNGGFQHFENKIDDSGRKLSANTVWAGARLLLPAGYNVKYSFIFDRATNTGDRVATDNITNAVYAGKVWPRYGGLTAGYQRRINDDYDDQVTGNAFYAAGWLKPRASWTLKGEFGAQQEEVTNGVTLTGDQDYTRYNLSATYDHRFGTVRLAYDDKKRENKDIGSSTDFRRIAADLVVVNGLPGEWRGSYAYAVGEYENRCPAFAFRDHVLSGAWLSPMYCRLQAELDGTYYRSQRDLDVESFSLRAVGRLWFLKEYHLEVAYAALNFDDLLVRNQYYTANVVEVSIIKKL